MPRVPLQVLENVRFGTLARVCPRPVPVSPVRVFSTSGARFQGKKSGSSHRKNDKSTLPRRILYASAAVGAAYVIDEYYYASVAQRSIRAVYILSLVAYKYANAHTYESVDQLHEECAELIFAMIRKNKGLYVKLGQAIANQGALFPAAYQSRFTRLYDDAPNDAWSEVDRTLRRYLGPSYETDIFLHFDHVPIASASIAQVHKACLREGNTPVAVKVQHPYISRQIDADLAVYRIMSWVYSKVFDLPLDFSTAYISAQLLKEADFTHECANSQRLATYIESDPSTSKLDVYVPNSYPQYAASQVLVTEWIDGVSLTDRQRLIDSNFSLHRLMTQYTTIFAKQIFDYGFVHSDPHPGNILVRFINGRQQIVILDHGLYIELPPKFKEEYCSLWRNLLGFDSQKIVDLSNEWGIGSPELLKSMVQLKPPEKIKAENAPSSTELLRMLLADEEKFPPDLLFLSRTMRMMQNLNQSMGSPINRINLLTEISLQTKVKEKTSWAETVSYVTVRVTLFFSNVVFWLFRARQILLGDRYGDKGEGLEDYIDKYLKENARALGINLTDEA
ncbi:hypothetical protein JCM33374_g4163 [Metschnikowia sp. JCM 33374]|nr:hypothetical protein JCM33374_g4163 [Metschnikowia sp. JCM 33374]